jgi:peptide chain release factor 1
MFEKIEIFDKRYSELSERLYQPSVAGNPEEYQKIMKEIKSIEEIVLTKKTALKFLRKQATKSLKSLLRSSLTRLRIISKILRKI